MTEPGLRKKVVELIVEAVKSGARLSIACEEAEISTKTYNRWIKDYNKRNEYVDKRTIAIHPEPYNKLSQKKKIRCLTLSICLNSAVHHPVRSYLP
jgi:hypothetical protein